MPANKGPKLGEVGDGVLDAQTNEEFARSLVMAERLGPDAVALVERVRASMPAARTAFLGLLDEFGNVGSASNKPKSN